MGGKNNLYGLVGKDIDYSFSRTYFNSKFNANNRLSSFRYKNFDIKNISEISEIFKIKNLKGLNVTKPYKEKVIPFLDEISKNAKNIGAVNTISFKKNKIVGDNTDINGFEIALMKFIGKKTCNKALILGTGGASKAVKFVLNKKNIELICVSRKPKTKEIHYEEVNDKIISEYPLIINCSPVGTFPEVNSAPKIPYQFINSKNFLFDLIYNPELTKFMKYGLKKGAKVCNGFIMLIEQAEESWKLWK